jgi:hypothetical protein
MKARSLSNLKAVPDTLAAILRIPNLKRDLKEAIGEEEPHVGSSYEDITNKIIAGNLQRQIEQLRQQIKLAEDKFETVAKMSVDWEPVLIERDNVVFQSRVGDTAKVPIPLLVNIIHGKAIDLVVSDRGDSLEFRRGKELIACVPKSLLRLLKGKLCWCQIVNKSIDAGRGDKI